MKQAELIVGLLIAVILAVAISLAGGHYLSLQKQAAVGQQRGGVLESTSQGVAEGERIEAVQEAYNQGLQAGRQTFHETKEEAKRNEPQTAERAIRTVPPSVRNAYRERRRARERLGCAGSECEEGR